MSHIPVLLNEALSGLNLQAGAKIVDATLGEAGHALSICEAIGPQGTLLGIDLNQTNLEKSRKRLAGGICHAQFLQANFRNIKDFASEADGVLFDLGYSSGELEESGRGFSFQKDEPLLMRYGEEGLTAAEILNSWSEERTADILETLGEERFAEKIAREIVIYRKRKRILTTFDLNEIITRATPRWYQKGRLHPATKTYQALRMAVNDELAALEEGLQGAWRILKSQGRLVIISFHSLEDRLVKNFFRDKSKTGQARLITKKPMRPKREEVLVNARARSAKLRSLEKI